MLDTSGKMGTNLQTSRRDILKGKYVDWIYYFTLFNIEYTKSITQELTDYYLYWNCKIIL